MLIARRRAFEGGSETSSSAGDIDISGGDVSGGGGDFDVEVDTVMAEVDREVGIDGEIETERKIKLLRQLKRENAAADGGSTPATVARAPTGAAPVAAAATEEKPKKIKRGQIPGVKADYHKPVSAFLPGLWVLACLYRSRSSRNTNSNTNGAHCLMNRPQGKPIKDEERDGLKHLVQEIKGSWQRAKERQSAKSKGDKEDPVYHYMRLTSNRNAQLPMVWTLQEIDAAEFQRGDWFAGLRCSKKNTFQGTFNKLVDRAERQVKGFKWLSWQQVDE